jgi:ATP-dependent Clp protease ATP-binding subunit ClpA
MLQILDDGRLTDGQGRTVDFRNTVIIMTSNVGSHVIAESNGIGFSINQKVRGSQADVSKRLLEALRQTFRPEFLNRVDDIIVFNSLSKEHLSVIIDLQLARVSKMLADRGVKLEVTAAAKEAIMTEGYDASYGARPMRRAIQRLIQDPLALRLLAGDFLAGETVIADKDGESGKLRFVKQTEPVAV